MFFSFGGLHVIHWRAAHLLCRTEGGYFGVHEHLAAIRRRRRRSSGSNHSLVNNSPAEWNGNIEFCRPFLFDTAYVFLACRSLAPMFRTNRVHAYIRRENHPSSQRDRVPFVQSTPPPPRGASYRIGGLDSTAKEEVEADLEGLHLQKACRGGRRRCDPDARVRTREFVRCAVCKAVL